MRYPITRRWIRVAAVLVALATVVAGTVAVIQRPSRYTASASVLITPPSGDASLAVTGSDTLSRGTIIATYAQAYSSGRVVEQAFAAAGLPASAASEVTMATRVLAGTSIIRITATSGDRALAESAADAVATNAPQLAGYSVAFKPSVIQGASGSASPAGPSPALLVVMVLALGAVAGGVTYAGLSRLRRGRLARAAELNVRPQWTDAAVEVPVGDAARPDARPERGAPIADAPPHPAH